MSSRSVSTSSLACWIAALVFFVLPVRAQRVAVERLASPTSASFSSAFADGDENWDDRFGFPGVVGIVHAAATAADGDLYVGGYISTAGAHPVTNIARWDGRRWHALGEGVNGYVYAIAAAPNGDLYVGGDFVNAGTLRVNGLARWSPATQTWSQLANGVTDDYGAGDVKALAMQGDNLFVAGNFTKAGGVVMRNLAMWNGATFQPLGQGTGRIDWQGAFEAGWGTASALAVDGDVVYVGGNFEAVDAGKSVSVAAWNSATQTWSTIGGGLDRGLSYESAGSVNALLVHDGDLYVGGEFGLAGPFGGGVPAANIARWDGTAWSSFGTGLEGEFRAVVTSLAFVGDLLYVGGDFNTAGGRQARYVAAWDGANWSEPGGGYGSAVLKMAVGLDGALYVGGNFNQKAGDNVWVGSMGKWADGRWQGLGEGLGYESISAHVYGLANDGVRVYAAGYQSHAGGMPVNGIAAWNGQDWEALGQGTGATYGSGTIFTSVLAPNGEVYIGGAFTTAGGQTANHIAVWNPATRTWRTLGSGTNGAIYSIAIDGNNVYAGGNFTAAGGVVANYIARWDGAQWHAVGSGTNYAVRTVEVGPNGHVYIGGDFNRVGGFDANGIAVWNGANWSALGRGLTAAGGYSETAQDIVVIGADVYAVGDFVTAGTASAAGIARWTQATGWSALGTGLGGSYQTGYALYHDGDRLYVGGDFVTAGGLESRNIAIWNLATSSWEMLGSGVEGIVHTMTVMGDDLYLGGDIRSVGDGIPASSFVRWSVGGIEAVAHFGIDAQTLAFGDVTIGQTVDRTVKITNGATATGPLQLTISAPAAPFSIVSGGGAVSLAPGASHQVVVRFSPGAPNSYTGTINITHNGANAASPASVALSGNGVARGGKVVVLRTFDPAGIQQIVYAETVAPVDTGFVFGTNIFGDRAKGVVLDAPVGKVSGQAMSISQVDVYFSYLKPGIVNQSYTLNLYETDASGIPTGSPVYSETYRLADAVGDDDPASAENATTHVFAQTVSVTTPFAVAVDFGAYGSDAILAAVAVNAPVNERVENVWEQWSDGSWHNLSDAWTGTYSDGIPVPGSGGRGWQPWIEAQAVTATSSDAPDDLPRAYALEQNYPNPFNPTTTIEFALPSAGPVSLRVFDLTGRLVATLVEAPLSAGVHSVPFDAAELASGLYVYRLSAGSHQVSRLMTVLK